MVTAQALELAKVKRHDEWPKLRRKFLKWHDQCEVCGAKKGLVAHHIIPYHIDPKLELEISNLITLCERGANHHLFFGHLMDWMSYNPNIYTDAMIWNDRIKHRPKWKRSL